MDYYSATKHWIRGNRQKRKNSVAEFKYFSDHIKGRKIILVQVKPKTVFFQQGTARKFENAIQFIEKSAKHRPLRKLKECVESIKGRDTIRVAIYCALLNYYSQSDRS